MMLENHLAVAKSMRVPVFGACMALDPDAGAIGVVFFFPNGDGGFD